MYYRLLTGVRCWVVARQTLRVHSPGGSTFCVKCRNSRQLESVASNRKSDSVSWCIISWRNFLISSRFDLKRRNI